MSRNTRSLDAANSLSRILLAASSAESGIGFQTFKIGSKSVVRRFLPAPRIFNVCTCSVARNCPDPEATGGPFICYHGDNCIAGTVAWNVPGIVTACTYYERQLGTDLSCFFNQTCLDTMLSLFNVDMPRRLPLPEAAIQFIPLNSSTTSRFRPTTKFGVLFAYFMLEEWLINPNYEAHFRACAPTACTYTTTTRAEIIYVVSIIISFFGGLVVVFRLLVSVLVRVVYRIKMGRHHESPTFNQQRPTTVTGNITLYEDILK